MRGTKLLVCGWDAVEDLLDWKTLAYDAGGHDDGAAS